MDNHAVVVPATVVVFVPLGVSSGGGGDGVKGSVWDGPRTHHSDTEPLERDNPIPESDPAIELVQTHLQQIKMNKKMKLKLKLFLKIMHFSMTNY